MKPSWYQTHPDKIFAIASSLPDQRLRANFHLVFNKYLCEGGLPDDDKRVAFLCGLPIEDIQAFRPYWDYLGRVADGRIFIDYAEEVMAEKRMFVEKKAKAAKERWGRAAESKNDQTNGAQPVNHIDDEILDDCDASDDDDLDPAPTDDKQRNAVHSNAIQSNSSRSGVMPDNQPTNQTENKNKTNMRAREALPENSLLAKLDAMQNFILAEYGYGVLEPWLERQVITAVGKLNASGFGLDELRQFLGECEKLPEVQFLPSRMQKWRAENVRKPKIAAAKANVVPIQANQTPGLCNTCFGNLTVPYKDPETNLVKGRKPCPKCAVQQKTA